MLRGEKNAAAGHWIYERIISIQRKCENNINTEEM